MDDLRATLSSRDCRVWLHLTKYIVKLIGTELVSASLLSTECVSE